MWKSSMARRLGRLAVAALVLVFGAFDSLVLVGQQRRQEGGLAGNFTADGAFTGSSVAGWRPVGGASWRAENSEVVATAKSGGTKRIFVYVTGEDRASYRVTLDAQHRETSCERLRPPPSGHLRVAPPPPATAPARPASGGRPPSGPLFWNQWKAARR